MSDHQLVVYLILLVPVVIGVVTLLAVAIVWTLDTWSEDQGPARHVRPRRAVYDPEPVSPLWVENLPRAHTPWDVPPLTRAQLELAAILYAVDRAQVLLSVPQLQPSWVATTKRQLELEAGL